MFTLCLRNAKHVRQYSVAAASDLGWEVRLIEDDKLSQHAYYHDWHRVERSMALFRREAKALEALGWQITRRGESQN